MVEGGRNSVESPQIWPRWHESRSMAARPPSKLDEVTPKAQLVEDGPNAGDPRLVKPAQNFFETSSRKVGRNRIDPGHRCHKCLGSFAVSQETRGCVLVGPRHVYVDGFLPGFRAEGRCAQKIGHVIW